MTLKLKGCCCSQAFTSASGRLWGQQGPRVRECERGQQLLTAQREEAGQHGGLGGFFGKGVNLVHSRYTHRAEDSAYVLVWYSSFGNKWYDTRHRVHLAIHQVSLPRLLHCLLPRFMSQLLLTMNPALGVSLGEKATWTSSSSGAYRQFRGHQRTAAYRQFRGHQKARAYRQFRGHHKANINHGPGPV